jgi:hypothetical protein
VTAGEALGKVHFPCVTSQGRGTKVNYVRTGRFRNLSILLEKSSVPVAVPGRAVCHVFALISI